MIDAIDGTGDQVCVDTDPVYSLYANAPPRPPAAPYRVRSFESKYQHEQQGSPAYLGCRWGACLGGELRPPRPMRKQSVYMRENEMAAAYADWLANSNINWRAANKRGIAYESTPTAGLNEAALFMMLSFLFVLLVVIFALKAVSDLAGAHVPTTSGGRPGD